VVGFKRSEKKLLRVNTLNSRKGGGQSLLGNYRPLEALTATKQRVAGEKEKVGGRSKISNPSEVSKSIGILSY